MRRVAVLTLGLTLALAAWAPRVAPVAPRAHPGWALYDRYCLACHGAAGEGRGPAAPFTRGKPRDLVRGEHAWRTTPLGAPPSDDDLRTTLRFGAAGTSMPGFDGILSPAQIDQLIDLIKAFSPRAFATPAAPVELGPPPPVATAARGAELWARHGCVACHGADGSGVRSLPAPPHDLTRGPLHRPHAPGELRRATALSIATGVTGAMPSYAGSVADAELWALADHVLRLNARARPPEPGAAKLEPRAIDADREARLAVATWPGDDPDEARVFGAAIPPQGPPPAALAPAQASLSAGQCARCHAKQHREWAGSLHRGAASPGLAAQRMGMAPAQAAGCLRCHAPLAEQRSDDRLLAQGVSCAGCHVRGWTRHGPPGLAPSLLPIAGYPLAPLAIYERADLCLPCHQLPPRTAVDGKPLLDTYREWLEGPYMRRGVQCQHCHMPNREHSFLGVHDPDTFRQGIALTARAHVRDGVVTVVAALANVGAGHYLPTNPTPAAWLRVELVDARGEPIAGAAASSRIGRDIEFDGARWHQRADTRIAPGERHAIARAWSGGRTAGATGARITVEVHPDDYYERVYRRQLAGALPAARRALYEQALARATASHYIAEQRVVPIARSP